MYLDLNRKYRAILDSYIPEENEVVNAETSFVMNAAFNSDLIRYCVGADDKYYGVNYPLL